MRRWIYLVMAFLLACPPAGATDYILLEALISSHKAQSNRLKERISTEGSVAVTQTLDTKNSTKYEEQLAALRKRFGDITDYVIFAGELVHIGTLTKDVAEKEVMAVDKAMEVGPQHPKVLARAIELETEFGQMVKELAELTVYVASSGVGATLSTPYQRRMFCNYISGRLNVMKTKLNNFIFYARCMNYTKCDLVSWAREANSVEYEKISENALSLVKAGIDKMSK
jgi:hypothetical protein